MEAAIEAREEHRHRLEREERRVLFDVLQAGWSDSTFSAEWARLEAEEEAWAEDGLTVVGAEDRLETWRASWASEPDPARPCLTD